MRFFAGAIRGFGRSSVRSNRIFVASLIFLAAVHAALLVPGFFAPYDPAEQDRDFAASAPTRIHLVDGRGKLHAWPFVYAAEESPTNPDEYEEVKTATYPIRLFVRGPEYRVLGIFSADRHLFGASAPAHIFLAGTDEFGRDLFSRMVFGAQLSLYAGLLAAGVSLLLGLVIGGLAGYAGGLVDSLLMRWTELFMAVPWLFLLFAVRATLPLHVSPAQAFLLIITVIGIVGWARPARLVRGITLAAKERDFVSAARGFGASDAYLLRRHVLPQAMPVIWTQAALLVPQFILAELFLSFLGLGVGEPAPSLGNLLASLQQVRVLQTEWWMYLPALVLVPVFLAYNSVSSVLAARAGGVVS